MGPGFGMQSGGFLPPINYTIFHIRNDTNVYVENIAETPFVGPILL